MAALGLGLGLAPERIWKVLSAREQINVSAWLNQINAWPLPDNNWVLFRMLVNLGLRAVGTTYSDERLRSTLDRLDAFYLGDGWYADGVGDAVDYYAAFGMHFDGLLYNGVMRKDDPGRATVFMERAQTFSGDFISWFSENGAALPFGRSLTYRFAQCAFWGSAAFAGLVDPVPLGGCQGVGVAAFAVVVSPADHSR